VERGIFSKLNLPQELSRLLGKGNADIDAGSHFKSSGGSQSWDNLKMPMVVIFLFILNGSGMDDIIIIGIVQFGIEFK
jgi:hypothetical protein